MADERTDKQQGRLLPPTPADLAAAAMEGLTPPGLVWTQAVVEGTRRAQAALASTTLRQLGAPVVDALAKHHEMATALERTAHQMAEMSRHVEQLASQHTKVAAQLQAAMEPYLRYIEWLDRESTPPSSDA